MNLSQAEINRALMTAIVEQSALNLVQKRAGLSETQARAMATENLQRILHENSDEAIEKRERKRIEDEVLAEQTALREDLQRYVDSQAVFTLNMSEAAYNKLVKEKYEDLIANSEHKDRLPMPNVVRPACDVESALRLISRFKAELSNYPETELNDALQNLDYELRVFLAGSASPMAKERFKKDTSDKADELRHNANKRRELLSKIKELSVYLKKHL